VLMPPLGGRPVAEPGI